ncbi:hypothetical protein BJ875DRAFT_86006 [Amylocarpus encephaloides]|uniref:Uncharacterized protein n=1 Tax=Amylocarpus encephaloides TaxID=45428 RepID=A0A9P7YTH3_9HELO|nr:hypothetical protein BJ875DRAFT_86006 [Amylocarpus encephaloides]
MSGVSSWLQKMRKAELIELCDSVNFTDYDGMRKADIEAALDGYLTDHANEFSSESRFDPFYKTRRGNSSPVKKESASTATDLGERAKSFKRRVTKAAEELAVTDDSEAEPAATRTRSALTRTPARSSALANLPFASSVPLPPSPAVVANAIERKSVVLRSKLSEVYQGSGINETTEATRTTLSSLVAIHVLIHAFELLNLRKELLPNRYAFTIPEMPLFHMSEYPVSIPDLFLLLTSSFWGPANLWSLTSFVLPLGFAYFFNLTGKPISRSNHSKHFAYNFDPLTFNIVKALLTSVIYGQDVTFGGLVDLEHVARINSALYGGWKGPVVGTAIGALTTIYEAIIKK